LDKAFTYDIALRGGGKLEGTFYSNCPAAADLKADIWGINEPNVLDVSRDGRVVHRKEGELKTFRMVRTDKYIVSVEAESLERAEERVGSESEFLNGGEFCGSDFEVDTIVEEN